jgi:hypothetical protein
LKSFLNNTKSLIIDNLLQIPGWHSKKRIVVIESDDWGMIRMANKEAYYFFLKKGYKVDSCPYNRFDCLESDKDIESLYEVLNSVRDSNNNPARLTLNNVVGNPNFQSIKDSNYTEYYWESFIDTYKHYPKSTNVFGLYKEGLQSNLIKPQFHGREHIGLGRWLDVLKSGNIKHLEAFYYNMYSLQEFDGDSCSKNFLNSFAPESNLYEPIEKRVTSGLEEFKRIWGFNSESLIAPCYTWNKSLENTFYKCGVNFIQGKRAQIQYHFGKQSNTIYHYTGEKNSLGQIYLIRNVHFEPVENDKIDHVSNALNQIQRSFYFNKPAIISTHRVNYVGSIQERNRDNGLKLLKILLQAIIKKWPDVIFLTSDELGLLIKLNNN